MRRAASAGLLVALVVGVVAAQARPAGVEVVDRTLRCTTGIQGGVPVIMLTGRSAFGQGGGPLEWLAEASVTAAGQPVPTKPGFFPMLAGLTAGWPPPAGLTSGALGFHAKRCTSAHTRVSFSRRGLTGGPVSQLGDEYRCLVPKSLLVRVRAVFRGPTDLSLIAKRTFYSAAGRIDEGQIAVRTLAGKPVVYADVADSGRGRLFISKACS